MAKIHDFIGTAPLAGVVTPLVGAAIPGMRDQIFNIAGVEDEEKKKREAKGTSGTPTTPSAPTPGMKKGGKVSCGMKKGGKVRGCGIAQRGKTKGKMV